MGSSPTLRSKDSSVFTKERHTIQNSMKIHTSSLRSSSLSSLSSSSSSSSSLGSSALYDADDYPSNPIPNGFSRIPFSWEQLPGVPKEQVSNKKRESSMKNNNKAILPLPPTITTHQITSRKKLNIDDIGDKIKKSSSKQISFQRDDPFFAALVECSKESDQDQEVDTSFWNGAKVSRSLSDRFGFVNLYTSCKKTCAVSESIIYLPKSTRNSYNLINRST